MLATIQSDFSYFFYRKYFSTPALVMYLKFNRCEKKIAKLHANDVIHYMKDEHLFLMVEDKRRNK